jgi:hypothetical protein
MTNDQFVVLCIAVDSDWRDLVDLLMPDHDWQQYRDRGEQPVARGTVFAAVCEYLVERLPNIEQSLMEIPPAGKAKAIVLDEGGGTVYEIEPQPEDLIQ